MKLARVRNPRTGSIIKGEILGEDLFKTEGRTFKLSNLDLLAPVDPSKIICVGLNYRDHIEETGSSVPDRPSLFFKPPTAIANPGDPIEITEAHRYDPEGEIAAVIGEDCRNVDRGNAFNYIWGFTGLNDVTNRDAQSWEQNWIRAKGFDTAAPLGPVLITPDEIDLPISFKLKVNGSIRQSSDTSNLIFDFPDLVEEMSSFMTLRKGDVISTGTPRGVAPITSGDTVRLEIEGIGTLENHVKS
ncbi:fumarylacetoacetate hydrolase family protein [Candidatus Bipolaricaulota bacterium]|nr:fumarylacetoacetate hydrolase family protein [Candidatus Bipolaricaulota bacterium]